MYSDVVKVNYLAWLHLLDQLGYSLTSLRANSLVAHCLVRCTENYIHGWCEYHTVSMSTIMCNLCPKYGSCAGNKRGSNIGGRLFFLERIKRTGQMHNFFNIRSVVNIHTGFFIKESVGH